jgi:ribulose 1,5-bisphosphate carboxylase large subunit-like protein
MAYFAFLRLARFCGADAIHVGSIGGKLPHAIIGDDSELKSRVSWLLARMSSIHRTMPIVSGGMHPGSVEWNVKRLGSDIILQAGSGVIGHPDGPYAGGKAMWAAVKAVVDNVPAYNAAREVPELETAFRKWGYLDRNGIHALDELWETPQVSEPNVVIHTEGGAVIWGDVSARGDFVGRDQISKEEDVE